MTDISQAKFYRTRIKVLYDQAEKFTPDGLARALAELAFQINPEATVIKTRELELRRVRSE